MMGLDHDTHSLPDIPKLVTALIAQLFYRHTRQETQAAKRHHSGTVSP